MKLRVLLAVMLVSALVLFPAGAAADDLKPNALTLTLIDAQTHQPLPQVPVTVHHDGQQQQQRSNRDGQVIIPGIQTVFESLYIQVKPSEYVPMALLWRAPGSTPADVPTEYTLRLQRGVPIGGRVVDDAGNPVANAGVSVRLSDKQIQPPERLDVSFVQVRTGDDGTWIYPTAPPTFSEGHIGAYHHDYVTRAFYPMNKVDPAELRDQSATITLERGVMVEGVVTGSDGRPVAHARVGVGSDRVASNVTPEIRTGFDGRFRFGATPGELIVVTVKHRDYAPELVQFTMPAEEHSLKIALAPAATIRGTVVDTDGNPVPEAWIFVDAWRGHRTITHRTQTDDNGRFHWDSAPADDVAADISAAGYQRKNAVTLTHAHDNHIVIQRPTVVRGAVIDAETDAPIKAFRVIPGIHFEGNNAVHWQREEIVNDPRFQGSDGAFEFEITWAYPGHAVRIEADGYLPAESRVFSPDEQEVVLAFQLKKGTPIKGSVRDDQGNPVDGASVFLLLPDKFLFVTDGHVDEHTVRDYVSTKTNAAGGFTLSPQEGKYTVVIVADEGAAQVTSDDLANSTDITLSRWGSVEGRAMIGTQPAGGATIRSSSALPQPPSNPYAFFQSSSKADAEGRFTIERVLPGPTQVMRVVSPHPHMTADAGTTTVQVEPGRRATAQVGGTGRPVVGRIDLPPELQGVSWTNFHASIVTQVDRPQLPAEIEHMSPEERQQWYQQWVTTPEGQAYLQAAQEAQRRTRSIPLMISRDGTFRADDVAPGQYRLMVALMDPPTRANGGRMAVRATAEAEFTIDPIPGGVSDEPLELPPISAKMPEASAE